MESFPKFCESIEKNSLYSLQNKKQNKKFDSEISFSFFRHFFFLPNSFFIFQFHYNFFIYQKISRSPSPFWVAAWFGKFFTIIIKINCQTEKKNSKKRKIHFPTICVRSTKKKPSMVEKKTFSNNNFFDNQHAERENYIPELDIFR